MRWTVAALAAVGTAAGCTPKLDPIPTYEEGVISEGDCDLEQIEEFDAELRSAVWEVDDPLVVLPGEYGRVLTSENEYLQFMYNANFDIYAENFPVIRFEEYNAAATWISIPNGCGFEIEERHLNRKKDGGLVFDVLFFDAARNCDQVCGETHNVLVMDAIPKREDVSICRRIRPGCQADASASSVR